MSEFACPAIGKGFRRMARNPGQIPGSADKRMSLKPNKRMKTLFLIPARGGSKGIPHKNIKDFAGKPLILYAVDQALSLADTNDICVSTDDKEIKSVVESYGVPVPFLRPAELATDQAGSYETMLHALDFYQKKGIRYDTLILLQPTSPFRTVRHIQEARGLYERIPGCDMVVSVKEAESNPYYAMYKENEDGYLQPLSSTRYTRRQDCPAVYEYNGAVYVIRTSSLRQSPLSGFRKIVKYKMDAIDSIDLDTPLDWMFAEFLQHRKME